MLLFHKITELAHHAVAPIIRAGDIVIDATAGNGFDTLFLASKIGPEGRVYAFDVQEEALSRTADLLSAGNLGQYVSLIHAGHEKLKSYVSEQVSVVMYNLGYLPQSKSGLTTRLDNTLGSFEQALTLLKPGGVITMVLYPGHKEGKLEKEGLLPVFKGLPSSQYAVVYHKYLNKSNDPPELVVIQKYSFSR